MQPPFSNPPAVLIEPITVRVSEAVQMTGICRAKIFELIATGELGASKVGRSTLIHVESLKQLIEATRKPPRVTRPIRVIGLAGNEAISPGKHTTKTSALDIFSCAFISGARRTIFSRLPGEWEPNPRTDGPWGHLGGRRYRENRKFREFSSLNRPI